ncbi:PAS domain-containing protein [Kiloniella sp. b19]|uniref:PAS domain-containing protein n=1 Tax=Kiloniella sp. GXU_MW_B19 TaxID=3141326 RepID=UPI0031E051C8
MKKAELAELYRYWESLREENGTVPKKKLDPAKLPKILLPNMAVLEKPAGEDRFRYRLAGTALSEGIDPSGQYLDDVLANIPAYADHLNILFNEALHSRTGLYSEHEYEVGPPFIRRLILPMTCHAGLPSFLIKCTLFKRSSSAVPMPWQSRPQQIRELVRTTPGQALR